MEIIKARIWNPAGNSMLHDIENVYDCLMQQLAFDKTQPTRGFTIPYDHKADGMVWMFFSGIKDKNGVEVFSGDIVKCTKGVNDSVTFKNGSYWLEKRNVTLHRFINELEQQIEVVGNIFANPELAEV